MAHAGTVSRYSQSPNWLRRPYLPITLGIIAIVGIGFWPGYYGPLLRSGAVNKPWVIHLHGAVYAGWLALLLTQVWLAAAGRVRQHRRVGQFGMIYGVLVWLMGMVVTFAAPVMHIQAGERTLDQAAGQLILTLGDMTLFGGFFGGAMLYRHRPEIHKRLILAATVALAFAGVARMGLIQSPALFLLVWLSPMLAAMGAEFAFRRRVHPVLLVSTAILGLAFFRGMLRESEGWLVIGRAILRPLL